MESWKNINLDLKIEYFLSTVDTGHARFYWKKYDSFLSTFRIKPKYLQFMFDFKNKISWIYIEQIHVLIFWLNDHILKST